MRQIAGVFISGVFLFFAGCASNWQVTQQSHTNAKYSIQTPSQWMIIHEGTTTILSRHGPILESIRILSHSLQDTLPHTRLRVYPDMMPHEIGEALFYTMIANQQNSHVAVEEMSVQKVDGRNAVKVKINYMVNDIPCCDLVYAFIQEPYLYQLRYSATRRYYYEKGVDEFEQVVKSFRLK
ncbi:MAG TPA: hypothetical protein VKY57_00555 [Chitinispirillaceae bacterium]|jgi:hypothetical protein|nr:hypothetical protein [Chitinispirillaceae bacterium]